MAEHLLPKQAIRVRFPLGAPNNLNPLTHNNGYMR